MANSWSHLAVRPLVRPLIRVGARPNQITAFHLVLGLASLSGIAWGSPAARLWAGIGWLVSVLLDRLDGELARIGAMCSAAGHRFDYLVDMWLSALYFLALGIGVGRPYAALAVACGAVAFACQLASGVVAERFDRLAESETMLGSRWGFDADDALYVLGPLAWLPSGLRFGAVVLAAGATAGFLALFVSRLARLRRRLALSS